MLNEAEGLYVFSFMQVVDLNRGCVLCCEPILHSITLLGRSIKFKLVSVRMAPRNRVTDLHSEFLGRLWNPKIRYHAHRTPDELSLAPYIPFP
jgi:hypothetical protein